MSRFLTALFVALGLTPAFGQVTLTNGLYARFDTSMGSFTCQLRPDLAPRTVANFVGLAEGTKTFLDQQNIRIAARPFYSGITFHRVVTNFVIQGGSPNGQGTDGPGYTFADEFSPQLRHNAAGVLSMANSGPHSNGSQFFVTLKPTPWLDDVHSVFGSVVNGLSVVQAIGNVATTNNSVPIVSVIIQQMAILRVGEDFTNYSASAIQPALPALNYIPCRIASLTSNSVTLAWNLSTNSVYRRLRTETLETNESSWFYTSEFINNTTTVNGVGTATFPTFFFQILETHYSAKDW
jgi:cyclophilin family peptidyl-prolyl cis-trans isomerase